MGDSEIASLEVLVRQSRRQLARLSLSQAVERYFEVSLYLLIVTGFATLASTGRLDALSLIVVLAALIFRGYLLVRNRKLVIPERWTAYFTVGYVLFYAADYYAISRTFVGATVHLVLFSMVVRIFSAQRNRDQVFLAILAFLLVLAAAILTVDSLFLGAFAIFMLLAVTTFVSMEMKRSAAAAETRARESTGVAPQAMAASLSGAGVVIVLAILAAASAIFYVLPRLSAGYLSAFSPQNQWVSGFSDNVRLGEIGVIKQSDTVVMHIQVEGEHGGATELKWRGVALALFDGRNWSNPAEYSRNGHQSAPAGSTRIYRNEQQHSATGHFDLAQTQVNLGNLPAALSHGDPHGFHVLRYRVEMEPLGTNVLFLAAFPVSVIGGFQEIGIDHGGAVTNLDRRRLTESYSATSLVPQPVPGAGNEEPLARDPNVALRYLQLPNLDRRVRPLAEQITASARSDFEKAVAIEQYLKTHYAYTLNMGSSHPQDPLAYFLFDRKQGHCEYFASAMTVMLRTLNIPSRMVNGFRGAEYNDLTDSYIVRGRNAHSWVEVYIPGYSWLAFDPTPPDPMRVQTRWARFLLYVDAAREFWREWVVLYDAQRQQALATTAMVRGQSFFERTRGWITGKYRALLERARGLSESASASPKPIGAYGVGGIIGIILLVNLPRWWRALRGYRISRRPERAPQAAATLWYLRLTRTLARQGWRKLPSQTPQEFAATIDDPRIAAPVAQFTLHYERARFGDTPEDAQRLPRLYQQIRSH